MDNELVEILVILAGGAAFIWLMVWANARVLNPLAALILQPRYSWQLWPEGARKLSGIWQGERVEFTVFISRPATFSLTIFRHTPLPDKTEVRINGDGMLVIDQVNQKFLVYDDGSKVDKEDLATRSSSRAGAQEQLRDFFNSSRVSCLTKLLSKCKMDVVLLDDGKYVARTSNQNSGLWKTKENRERVETALPLLMELSQV